MIKIKPEISELPEYQAGRQGTPQEAAASGVAQLSSNESPEGPTELVIAEIAATLPYLNRYPSMSAEEMRTRIAQRHNLSTTQIVVGTGGVEIGRQAAAITVGVGDEVIFADPSFPEYAILTRLNGGREIRVPLTADSVHDLTGMAKAVTPRTRLIIVCNPNNPTGTGVATSSIKDFMADVPNDCLVLVDEAYWEFTGDALGGSAVELVSDFENLVVLRTFSKAFGLAGLRIGYGVASGDVATAMRKVQIPFSASLPAQVAAMAALDSTADMAERTRQIIVERERIRGELIAAGFAVAPSYANFLWIDGVAGQAVLRRCEEQGVHVRPLGPRGVRLTIGSEAENDRLLAACLFAAHADPQSPVHPAGASAS